MRVLYLDSFFLFEMTADLTMLWAAGKLCGAAGRTARLAAAAALGAAYSAFTVIGALPSSLPLKLCVSALMLITAYGGEKRLWRFALAFFCMSAVFAGLTVALNAYTVRALLLSLCISAGICAVPFRFAARGGSAEVTIRTKAGEVKLKAFKDTGNRLREPISGGEVIVSGEESLAPLFAEQTQKLLRDSRGKSASQRLLELGAGFRLIPYRTVDTKEGLLLAFRPDEVIVDGKRREGVWAAISPTEISVGGDCSALIGGD